MTDTTIAAERRPLDELAGTVATAAAAVDGVHALGSLLARASDAVRERVGLASAVPGVKIDDDRAKGLTATVSVVIDYPHPLHAVANAIRDEVRTAVAPLTPRPVEVDVVVTGVFGPGDTEPDLEAVAGEDEETPDASPVAPADDTVSASRASEIEPVTPETATTDDEVAEAELVDREAADAEGAGTADGGGASPREVVATERADVEEIIADALVDAAADIEDAANRAREQAKNDGV